MSKAAQAIGSLGRVGGGAGALEGQEVMAPSGWLDKQSVYI